MQTGLKGVAGNKGAVAIRLDFDDSSFCFVTAHFAAGTSNVQERCDDFRTISDGLRFQRGKLIANHDSVIWLGDFNFRYVTHLLRSTDHSAYRCRARRFATPSSAAISTSCSRPISCTSL